MLTLSFFFFLFFFGGGGGRGAKWGGGYPFHPRVTAVARKIHSAQSAGDSYA